MLKAAVFDLDGTLLDSVDLHALAWQEAMAEFGHNVPFEDIRGQIGKAADTLLPVFLSERDRRDHGKELDAWRAARYSATYLQLVRPFSAVPALLRRIRGAGLRVAIASCPKRDDLAGYLAIAESPALWTPRRAPKRLKDPSQHRTSLTSLCASWVLSRLKPWQSETLLGM